MKNTLTELQILMEGFTSRQNEMEERISELEDKVAKFIQYKGSNEKE